MRFDFEASNDRLRPNLRLLSISVCLNPIIMSKRAISVDETKSSAFLKQQQEAATKPNSQGKARAMSLDTGNTNQERSISSEIVGEIKEIFFKMPAFEVSHLILICNN